MEGWTKVGERRGKSKGDGDDPEFGEFEGVLTRVLQSGSAFVDCPVVKELHGHDAFIHESVVTKCGLSEGDRIAFNVHVSASGKPQVSAPCWLFGEPSAARKRPFGKVDLSWGGKGGKGGKEAFQWGDDGWSADGYGPPAVYSKGYDSKGKGKGKSWEGCGGKGKGAGAMWEDPGWGLEAWEADPWGGDKWARKGDYGKDDWGKGSYLKGDYGKGDYAKGEGKWGGAAPWDAGKGSKGGAWKGASYEDPWGPPGGKAAKGAKGKGKSGSGKSRAVLPEAELAGAEEYLSMENVPEGFFVGVVRIIDESKALSMVRCPTSGCEKDVYVHKIVGNLEYLSLGDVVVFQIHISAKGEPQASAPFWKMCGAPPEGEPLRFGNFLGRVQSVSPDGSAYVRNLDVSEEYNKDALISSDIVAQCGMQEGSLISYSCTLSENLEPQVVMPCLICVSADKYIKSWLAQSGGAPASRRGHSADYASDALTEQLLAGMPESDAAAASAAQDDPIAAALEGWGQSEHDPSQPTAAPWGQLML